MYNIEKNVEQPKTARGELPRTIREMQEGDSILIDKNKRIYTYLCAKNAGIKVKTALEGDKFRVWRIA